MSEAKPQIMMRRETFEHLPALECPTGYLIRHFQSGDETAWNALMDVVFERTPGTSDFCREMAQDNAFRPERVWLVVDDGGAVVATASCWWRAEYGKDTAYLHWVATYPDHSGRKLGHWATLATMYQAVREGKTSMVLHTDAPRLAAVKTYLRLGFTPYLTDERQRGQWPEILETLAWPDRFEQALAAPVVDLDCGIQNS
ncbi:MAG: GNAT family N-acetyltransferase [Planctomycetota bacterium]|jgi:mycothiol synthase